MAIWRSEVKVEVGGTSFGGMLTDYFDLITLRQYESSDHEFD